MDAAGGFRARQIGNRARHAQQAGKAARRQPHFFRRIHQQRAPRIVGRGEPVQRLAIQRGIIAHMGAVQARILHRTRGADAGGDVPAPLGRGRQGKVAGGDRLHLDMQVDTVEYCEGIQVLLAAANDDIFLCAMVFFGAGPFR